LARLLADDEADAAAEATAPDADVEEAGADDDELALLLFWSC
jgi:hypothetical protein